MNERQTEIVKNVLQGMFEAKFIESFNAVYLTSLDTTPVYFTVIP